MPLLAIIKEIKMNLIEIFDKVLGESRSHFYEMGATLHKKDTGLPVNIWIDDMAWKQTGHRKRIKFQPDKGDRSDTRTFIPMSIEDNPQIKVKHPKLSIDYNEIEQIKQFIIINKELLIKYSDQEITIADFLNQIKKI
jgi:hypothetical protein